MNVLLLIPMADGLTGPAIKYGFEQLGHLVKTIDPRVRPLEEIFPAAREFRPDLVFCSRESVLVGPVTRIKQAMNVVACAWNVDTWGDIYHWGGLFPLIEACDYYFVAASRLISEWRKINKNTFWLPEGLQVEKHDKPKKISAKDRARYTCDMLAGSLSANMPRLKKIVAPVTG